MLPLVLRLVLNENMSWELPAKALIRAARCQKNTVED